VLMKMRLVTRGHGVWSVTKHQLFSLRKTTIQQRSQGVACARRCQSSRLTGCWTRNE
jgi:hypothetical protein